ncbi:MAG: PaaI family thioesterase [Tannerellaceae bacterium]|jgi:acyl-CoA thioesterase|nr:PaaI family thioesterase [Tannerellaceae bacterium]
MEIKPTIDEFFKGDRFALAAGVELLEVRHGYAKARMKITDAHFNAGNVCQGGAIFTLADLVFAVAVNSHAKLTFSITSSITFYKSESQGYLFAEAVETMDKQRLAHCEVDITNEEGEKIASFIGTGYRVNSDLPFAPV